MIHQQIQLDEQIQQMSDSITALCREALAALIARRDQRYSDETQALDAERENLTAEYLAIEEVAENLRELLPAKAREAQRAADALLLEGKREEAAAKLAEAQQAAEAPAAMNERQREICARMEAIDSEKRSIARTIFETWFTEDVQHVIRAAEKGLFITLLDGLERSFYEFQERTGTNISNNRERPLLRQAHIAGLTADERSAEWQAGTRWYGGRR